MKVDEFAQIAGCSIATLQSVESGRIPLSDDLAVRISQATGAAIDWLLTGDPAAPMIDQDYRPFTVETFERTQIAGRGERVLPNALAPAIIGHRNVVAAIITNAWFQKKGRDFWLIHFKLRRALMAVLDEALPHRPAELDWNYFAQSECRTAEDFGVFAQLTKEEQKTLGSIFHSPSDPLPPQRAAKRPKPKNRKPVTLRARNPAREIRGKNCR